MNPGGGATAPAAPAEPAGPATDQVRTARLVFDAELSCGALEEGALRAPRVRLATGVSGIPQRPIRIAQQVLYKLGQLDFESNVARPLARARGGVLRGSAAAPPRLLVRVDEFPHYRAWDEPQRFGADRFERFHRIMADRGIPYLIAVLPRVSRQPLSPAQLGTRPLEDRELAVLRRLAGDPGVVLGLHGRDHRTRHASPRRHSELCGLGAAETERLLEQALAELAPHGIRPKVFVPPYNRFDADQLELLARRFDVVCGGPESIGTMGFQRTPQWRGDIVYLPSYAPFYGRAAELLAALERVGRRCAGLWVPVVLHWGWEAEDSWRALERLAARMAPHAVHWDEFLGAVARSREGRS